jgi:hypothetical protein
MHRRGTGRVAGDRVAYELLETHRNVGVVLRPVIAVKRALNHP